MSHPIIKTACVVAGFAVASLAATSAFAAKPLSVKQKNEMAEAMARNYQAKQQKTALKSTARTGNTALGGKMSSDGTMSAELPMDRDIYLSASPDAKGNMHVRDTDASGPSTVTAVEVSDEI